MNQNVGTVDRVIRIVAGLAILSLAFIGPQSAWAYLGLVPSERSTGDQVRRGGITKAGLSDILCLRPVSVTG